MRGIKFEFILIFSRKASGN